MTIHNVPRLATTYLSRKADEELYKRLIKNKDFVIEIKGAFRLGKTLLVNKLIRSTLNNDYNTYKLIGWIDCTHEVKVNNSIVKLAKKLDKTVQSVAQAIDTLIDYCGAF